MFAPCGVYLALLHMPKMHGYVLRRYAWNWVKLIRLSSNGRGMWRMSQRARLSLSAFVRVYVYRMITVNSRGALRS